MAGNDQFRLSMRNFVEKGKANIDAAVRGVLINIGSRLVARSPVGDRELWAENDLVLQNRESFRLFQEERGKKVSERTLKKHFPTKGPKGYVGGRFRANWQLSDGAPATGELYQKSPPATSFPGPQAVLGDMAANMPVQAAGHKYYFTNNLPYAQRLEDGWSSQAPAGMVGLVTVEFRPIVEKVVGEVNP